MTTTQGVVIFDFDGVICDSLSSTYSTIQTVDGPQSLGSYTDRFAGNINDGIDEETMKRFWDRYGPHVSHQPTFAGISDVITQLATQYPLYIISSTPSTNIHDFLVHHQLREHFTGIFGVDVERSKVKKIGMVRDREHIEPHQCVMITDTLGDIREANEAGIPSIAVTWGYHDEPTIQKGTPAHIAHEPSDVPAYVASTLAVKKI